MFRAGQHALGQFGNCLRLIPGGRVVRYEFKCHGSTLNVAGVAVNEAAESGHTSFPFAAEFTPKLCVRRDELHESLTIRRFA